MQYVILPEEKTRRASFYLAMEEHVARRLPAGDYLFCWQIEPSVVFGRNQVMANEVNTAYCRDNNIGMFRRKSGGGCIYADMGNVMFSFITDSDNVGLTFNRYINMMVLMLRKIGVKAAATGRNDIVVDGRKVSGNAFYHLPGRSIVHGTMLYDTDMDNMLHAITPPDAKLESKGVESVRQRITLLKDHIDIGVDGLKDGIMRSLCDGEYALNAGGTLVISSGSTIARTGTRAGTRTRAGAGAGNRRRHGADPAHSGGCPGGRRSRVVFQDLPSQAGAGGPGRGGL